MQHRPQQATVETGPWPHQCPFAASTLGPGPALTALHRARRSSRCRIGLVRVSFSSPDSCLCVFLLGYFCPPSLTSWRGSLFLPFPFLLLWVNLKFHFPLSPLAVVLHLPYTWRLCWPPATAPPVCLSVEHRRGIQAHSAAACWDPSGGSFPRPWWDPPNPALPCTVPSLVHTTIYSLLFL